MSLTSSLLIGQSALSASQIALQVTGNNIANVSTPGFHRQSVVMSPVRGGAISQNTFVGRGVNISDVLRQIDPALQARVRSAIGDEQAAMVGQNILGQVEALMNELTGYDLSTQLGEFFNAFSELANSPSSTVTRSAVVERGATLASFMRGLRSDLLNQRSTIDTQLGFNVSRADELMEQITVLNVAVSNAEFGNGTEGALRDQRDVLVDELAGLLDITVIEQGTGMVDILVGSTPIVLGSVSRGLEFKLENIDGELTARVLASESGEELNITGGTIGGLMTNRDGAVDRVIDDLDTLASTLIFEVNRAHSQGRPGTRLTDVTSWLRVPASDQVLAFNDPLNETFADLPFAPVNGSFSVVITDQNGNQSTQTIAVDLDGIDSTGVPGFGDDTTLADIAAALDAIPNLNASIDASGALRLTTDAGYDVSFGDDTSGILAVLGVNSYFTGVDGSDIAIRADLQADPNRLTVGMHDGTNEAALAIAGLQSRALDSLNGDTLIGRWIKVTDRTAVETASTATRATALGTVRQSLEAQQSAISGVSIDEESVNLINYQQQYQGAARFISVVDELTQILLGLV